MKNKNIIMYLDGGWKVEGKLVRKEGDKFFLESDGDVYMVFRDKVSCMLIDNGEKKKKQTDVKMHGEYDSVRKEEEVYPPGRSYSGLEDGISGVSLPSDILLDGPKEPENDFSVSFSGNSEKLNIVSEE